MYRTCIQCNVIKDVKDFFGKEICYSCQYKNKISKLEKKVTKKCLICHTEIRVGIKKYCSVTCSSEAKILIKKLNFL